MLKAIRMIKDAKQAKGLSDTSLVVDVHPSRPDYRGFGMGETIVSLEADPSFGEMEEAGATIDKNSETHTVLDDMFLISGEIPRVTSYENGLKGALRFDSEEGDWFSDEMINDERFLMCNLKGLCATLRLNSLPCWNCGAYCAQFISTNISAYRQRDCHVHGLQPRWGCQRRQAR